MPYVPLELDIWEAVSNKIDHISNDDALQAIARAYYELHTLEQVTDGYRTLATAYSFTVARDQKAEWWQLSIQNRLKGTENIILDYIRELKDEQDRTYCVVQSVREAITEIEKEIRRLGY
jgi:hypothetical protein